MGDTDEQRLDDEDLAEATSEQVEEGADVEGHKWQRGADKPSDAGRPSRPS